MPDFESCRKCTERHANCHATCEKYKADQKAWEEKQRLIKKDKKEYSDRYAYLWR